MAPIPVAAGTDLDVSYTLHEARNPVSSRLVALHHGICHTLEQFLPLIHQLNERGLHAAMISQQSERSGWLRNSIGIDQYVAGKRAAVRQIERQVGRIGSYANHSMGALIGEEMQQRYPDLRRPTVLMAPIPLDGAWPVTWRIMTNDPLAYFKAVATLNVRSLASTPAQVRRLFFAADTPQRIVDITTAQLKHASFWMYGQLVGRFVLRPRIRKDDVRKLLLYSDKDWIFEPTEYKKTKCRYRPLEERMIAGGHDFFLENAVLTADFIAEFHNRHA